MAKDKLTDYDSTASGNLDVGGISVAEGMLPSGVNNAIRELMSHQADAFGAGTPLYVDQTNNRLGVGNAAPATALDVTGTVTADGLTVGSSSIAAGTGLFQQIQTAGNNMYVGIGSNNSAYIQANGEFRIATGGYADRVTVDSSGNVLVGTTSSSLVSTSTETGAQIYDGGFVAAANDPVAYFNRITSDGDIAQFRKNGSAVGSIGVYGDRIYYGNTADSGISFYQFSLIPTNAGGLAVDNTYDCGHSGYRWDDVYATNGTIQTSDANEKQQIAALTDAEMTAAKAISALFKTFKWNSAVEAKGDAARTHTGVIAQDVEAAMTAAGLDAGDYAFFISNTWWETQTEVPAVEAVDAVLDEDGNVVTEAVEAKEAYTRTDVYDTAEEAPEGAIERTRMGIRYPELLAFIGAATEQRLTTIEARIAALEAN